VFTILFVLLFSLPTHAALVDGKDLVLVPSVMELVETTSYTVKEGDNLYRIALAHEISVDELMTLNGLTGDLIHPGEVLKLGEHAIESEVAMLEPEPLTIEMASEINPEPEKVVVSGPIPTAPKPTKQVKVAAAPTSVPVKASAPVAQAQPAGEGVEMTVTATAYTAYCAGCSGTTAYGIDLRANPNQKVIAVDPRIIPLGTKVWIEGYGVAIAGDTGGAIKGHKIDVFIPSYESAMAWGVKKVKIKVLN
jgi:3D (Asp-Asp-Asp) domain-containing protein/LysM repeat protein